LDRKTRKALIEKQTGTYGAAIGFVGRVANALGKLW
jgi:hypothetical protein